jgi:hypothetical protein
MAMNTKTIKILSIIVIVLVYLNSCSDAKDASKISVINIEKHKYAKEEKNALTYLKEKKLELLLDTAKWYLYNTYCDVKANTLLSKDYFYLEQTNKIKNDIYLGSLELRLIEAHIDTITGNLFMGVYFFIDDSTYLLGNLGEGYGSVPDGVIMNLKDTTFLHFTTGVLNFNKSRIDAKSGKVFTASLKKYIEGNKNNLHPHYLQLLQKQNK